MFRTNVPLFLPKRNVIEFARRREDEKREGPFSAHSPMGAAYALIFMARSCPTMIRGSTVGGFLDIEGLTLECGLVAPAVNDLKGGAWLA